MGILKACKSWILSKEKYLRHPFVLLLFSIIIGSIVIPIAGYYISTNNLKQKTRAEIVDRIVERDFEISVLLNNLVTTVSIFDKDNCYLKDTTDLINQQSELRVEMNKTYLEFERHAWFWSELVFHKAFSTGLPDPRLKNLSKTLKKYNQNIVKCTEIVSKIWHACLSKEYQVCDPAISKEITETYTLLGKQKNIRSEYVLEMIVALSNEKIYSKDGIVVLREFHNSQ